MWWEAEDHLQKTLRLQLPQNGGLLARMLQDKGPHMVGAGQCPQAIL